MAPTRFHIPDLIALCGNTFELQANGLCRQVGDALLTWPCSVEFLTEKDIELLPGLQMPLLASLCYPSCDFPQLLLISKYLILLLHWSNKFNPRSVYVFERIKDQLSRETTSNWQRRFEAHMESFRQAHIDRVQVPETVEDYRALSYSYSGISTLFDLIEYGNGLRIPSMVHRCQEVRSVKVYAHDVIAIAKDMISHNYQQSRGSEWNLVSVIMKDRQCTLQSAIDVAESMFKEAVAGYIVAEEKLPSWTPEIDEDVQRYVQGLRECMIGFIHWLYETDRYFGDKKGDVREFGWVFLLPREAQT